VFSECAAAIKKLRGEIKEQWSFDTQICGQKISVMFFEVGKEHGQAAKESAVAGEPFSNEEILAILDSHLADRFPALRDKDMEKDLRGLEAWRQFSGQENALAPNKSRLLAALQQEAGSVSSPAANRAKFILENIDPVKRFRDAVLNILRQGLVPIVIADMDETLSLVAHGICPEEVFELIWRILEARGIFILLTGSGMSSVKKQFLSGLRAYIVKKGIGDKSILQNLILLPCNGTQMFGYDPALDDFKQIYIYPIENVIGPHGVAALCGVLAEKDNPNRDCILVKMMRKFKIPIRAANDQIENRISQISLSPYGPNPEDPDRKAFHDEDHSIRKPWQKFIEAVCRQVRIAVEIRIAGQTSIDITPKGIDKGFGIEKFMDLFNLFPIL